MPPLSRIDPLRFPKALADCWIIDAEADGRFRVRLAGEAMKEWYGFNPKGRCYEELFAPAVLPILHDLSRRVIDAPSIGYQRMRTNAPAWRDPAFFDRIALPLADADGRIRHLLGATQLKDPADQGKSSLESSVEANYWYTIPSAAA